ncbi:MAG: phosphate/phosphite/phosphonate ABC transporter substrate-binding protein [Halanaerobiales bacterium]
MKKIVSLILVSFMLLVFALPAFAAENGEVPDKLVLGMVPSREADKLVESLQPLADILTAEIGIPVETFVATNYTGLIEAIGKGKVDIGMFGSFSMVLAENRYDVEFLVNTVRYGANKYRAQYTVRADSGIESIADLEGKTVAFTDAASTSGYLFPYVQLKNEYGINPEQDLIYIFAGGHDAAVLSVYNGDADVALSFEDARTAIEAEHPDVMDKLKVIGYSNYIPNDGVVARKELDDELLADITAAFLTIGDTDEEVAILDEIFNASAFNEVSSEDYEVVRETYEEMKDQIEL